MAKILIQKETFWNKPLYKIIYNPLLKQLEVPDSVIDMMNSSDKELRELAQILIDEIWEKE